MVDRQLQRTLRIRIDLAQSDADVSTRDAAPPPQLRQDRGGAADRHGETDIAGARADRGVDPDHFAARIDQRSAAVAKIDRGVRLDVVVEAGVEQLSSHVSDVTDGSAS